MPIRSAHTLTEMERRRRSSKFEIEVIRVDGLDAALAEARDRGVSRAEQILAGSEMLSKTAFAKLISVSREAVRRKYLCHEVLGLKGGKRELCFPVWQVTPNGALLPELPRLFDLLGGDSWVVYRFLTQQHPELDGDTAISALQRGKISQVLTAAENTAGSFS